MRPAEVVTVVTVAHESAAVLPAFLARLAHSLPVVVVDSGSADWEESARVAGTAGARFLAVVQNVGYGTASNRGAAGCATPWVAFVNPDVDVDASALVALCETAGRHGFACVAPRLAASRSGGRPGRVSAPVAAATLPGACLVVRTDVFRSVGGFDERFFMFAEEDDLTGRIRATGGRTGRVDDLVAVTAGGGSSAGVGRRWAVAEREVGRCQLVLKRHGWAGFVLAATRSAVRVVRDPEMVPRRESARQVGNGLRRVVRLRGAATVREDVVLR